MFGKLIGVISCLAILGGFGVGEATEKLVLPEVKVDPVPALRADSYQRMITNVFGDEDKLKEIYNFTPGPKRESLEARRNRSSWDRDRLKMDAKDGHPDAQYCMYQICLDEAQNVYNGAKRDKYFEAAAWFLLSVYGKYGFATDDAIQLSEIISEGSQTFSTFLQNINALQYHWYKY